MAKTRKYNILRTKWMSTIHDPLEAWATKNWQPVVSNGVIVCKDTLAELFPQTATARLIRLTASRLPRTGAIKITFNEITGRVTFYNPSICMNDDTMLFYATEHKLKKFNFDGHFWLSVEIRT